MQKTLLHVAVPTVRALLKASCIKEQVLRVYGGLQRQVAKQREGIQAILRLCSIGAIFLHTARHGPAQQYSVWDRKQMRRC